MTNFATKVRARSLLNAALMWAPPLILLGLIAWGTLSPQDPMPKYFGLQDKFEHVGAFLLFSGALTFAAPRRFWVAVAAFGLFLAVGVEISQGVFTLHREPSLLDAMASLIGVLIGVAAGATLRPDLEPLPVAE